ncbi:MAG: NfeD family protein [Acidimicrobiales bacterium]|nr:NfeD family protein [Acidimicrobiales bacterium]
MVEEPEAWRWIWLVAGFVFLVGEMASPGSFFLLPFAAGAIVAAVLAFAGVGVAGEWIAFLGVSAAAFAALRPLARRLDRDAQQPGIGATRLVGQSGVVLEPIAAGDLGLVRIHREEWRAEALDGSAVAVGTPVKVVEVRGTRVIVWPLALPDGGNDEGTPA